MSTGTTTVKFTVIDLYEKMLGERAENPTRYELNYSRVMKDTVEHYWRAWDRAIKRAKAKAKG